MIGEELRKARIKAGLSQEALAEAAQLHRTTISLIERNKKSPTIATFLRLCRALDARPSRIIARIE